MVIVVLDEFIARMQRHGSTSSETRRNQSDMIMNATFRRDVAYQQVLVTHLPSNMKNKPFDAKYLVHTYYSITGDNIDYYLEFRPHVKLPIGSYVDVKDDAGKLQRWMIVARDDRPQFPQHYILKCNWVLKWIHNGVNYECLGVKRTQNSYNSGVWTDYLTTTVENQTKFWFPTTQLTQTVGYDTRVLINDEGRVVPIAWRVSKVEDTSPVGITKLTFTQEVAILHSDCGKYGLADYCKCEDHTKPKPEICANCPYEPPVYIDAGLTNPVEPEIHGEIIVNGSSRNLRVNGSARRFQAFFRNNNGEHLNHMPLWKVVYLDNDAMLCSVDLRFDYRQTDGNNKYYEWDVALAPDCPSGITLSLKYDDVDATSSSVDGCFIRCYKNNNEIFGIHVEPDATDLDVVYLRVLQLYNMVGKTLRISATNDQGVYYADIDMKVVS